MFHLVAGFLRSRGWKRWSVAQIETDSLVWWIFPPEGRTPTLVGKLPRTPLDVEIARREAAALHSLEPFAQTLNIPRLEFQSDTLDGRFLFLQSGISGRPLPDRTGQLEPVLNWLERLQSLVPPDGTLADACRQTAALCRTRIPDLRPAESQLLAVLESAAPKLRDYPATAVHGDFWTGNVLDDSGRLAVVDWSNFHFGSPLEDLHNFAAAQSYESRGGLENEMQSMWRVFFGPSPLRERTRLATTRILESRGIPPDLLPPLFLLFLAHRIANPEFCNQAAWRLFAARYMESGMPPPLAL